MSFLVRQISWMSVSSIIHAKYRTGSLRMLFREYSCKNAGVAGYAEAFTTVLSGKQASETGGYLSWIILGQTSRIYLRQTAVFQISVNNKKLGFRHKFSDTNQCIPEKDSCIYVACT